jgi:A/G-specific adenine glycosylase
MGSLLMTDRVAIEPLGFHNMRAEALMSIAAEYDALPRSPEALQTLPRVGAYVADASLCFALERRRPIVDRNVVRVYERVFGDAFPEDTRGRREFAEAMLPESEAVARTYNLGLLDFGALVCQKRDPLCETCFATDYCAYVN